MPGAKAFQLMTLLRGLGVEDLTKPELTGNWEYQLAEMEKGQLERETFMRRDRGDGRAHRPARPRSTTATPFPATTRPWRRPARTAAAWSRRTTAATPAPACPGRTEPCGFSISKIPGGRAFELPEVEAFLRDKKIGPLEGFRSKAGWPFTAEIKLVRDDEMNNWKLEFDFGEDARTRRRDRRAGRLLASRRASAPARSAQGKVYEFGSSYVCEHAVGANVTCDFKSGKMILQQPVAREQMTKLLATGKTDLLESFVSNKTRRKFKACLAWDAKEGKVVFEFEPRPGRPPAKRPGERGGEAREGRGSRCGRRRGGSRRRRRRRRRRCRRRRRPPRRPRRRRPRRRRAA